MTNCKFRFGRLLPALFLLGMAADRSAACSVCFGDPDSAMAKGAVAGVLVLAGVVLFVLAGVAGTGLFWLQRSRRLAREANVEPIQ